MNNEERMAAQLADLRIQDINRQMDAITKLARAYADATPEQRANVDAGEIQAQIERYENLKAERTNLYAEQEVRAQRELEAQRRAEQEAAQRAVQGTGRRVVVRNNNNNNNNNNNVPTLTDEQYAEWLAELEREAYLQNPHPIFNNGDGTYDYSDGTKRYADGTIVRGESNNIEVRTAPSGAPYYYDKTTGNQAQQIGTDANGNALVMDSQGGVKTMYPIQNAINNQILANRKASDAARGYNNALVDQNAVETDAALQSMAAATLLYNPSGAGMLYASGPERVAQASRLLGRRNVVPASRAMNLVSEGNIVNPTYGNSLSNWAQRYINTANKLANEQTVNNYARQVARNYNPILSEGNKIVQSSSSILPQGNVVNNGVQYLNGLFNRYTPFSL